MGMFDSFLIDVYCPFCKEHVKEFEFQTKDFNCHLDNWRVGDEFQQLSDGLVKNVYGYCHTKRCKELQTANNNNTNYLLVADVIIEDGIVKGITNPRTVI